MSKAAQSLFVFGIYLIALGLFLLTAPNTLITLFGLPETQDVWLHVVGMLLLLLTFYNIPAARHEGVRYFNGQCSHGRLLTSSSASGSRPYSWHSEVWMNS